MTSIQDSELGNIQFVDEEDGHGVWEFILPTPKADVTGSMWGEAAGPPASSLHLMKTFTRQLAIFEQKSLEAIAQFIKDDPAGLDFPEGETAKDWLGLSSTDFDARFNLESVKISDENQLVLIFATDLEGESGLGVEFDGQIVVRVDSGGNF